MTATLDRPTMLDPAFTVDRSGFADAAATVARALPSRPSVPILAGARLTVDGDTLTLAGFDYETSTEVILACDGSRDGTVIVSGALLAQIAKALPAKPVNITVDGNKATVKCGTSRFTLPTMDANDYPKLPEVPAVSGTVDAGVLAKAIDAVKSAVGTDDALPMLTGLRITFEQATMTLAATDRFRLAVQTIQWECAGDVPAPILVPGKSMVEAARGMDSGPVTLAVGDGVLGVQHSDTSSTMRMLDAEYPAYAKLLPASHERVAEVDVAELEQAVKRSALVSERGARVALTFERGIVTVASGGDDSSAASETVPCTLAGEGMTIAFNPGYLLAGLATIDRDNVLIGMSAPGRPAVFAPGHGMPDETGGTYPPVFTDAVYLLMPVRMPS